MAIRNRFLRGSTLAAGIILAVAGSAPALAADEGGMAGAGILPPNAKPGECYAKVMTPAQYKTVQEKVIVHEAGEKIDVIPAKYDWAEVRVPTSQATEKLVAVPATYETVTEKVEVEPAHTVWRTGPGSKASIASPQLTLSALAMGLPKVAKPGQCYNEFYQPARYETKEDKILKRAAAEKITTSEPEFEWVEEKVLVKEAAEKIVEVPAQYEVVTEKVLESPAYTTWKKGRGPNQKIDNATGEIMCLVEIPAKYKTIEKQVLKTPATIKKIEIPAEYKMVKVKKIKNTAGEKREPIQAEYQTLQKREKVADAKIGWYLAGTSGEGKATGTTLCLSEVPARHETITKQVLKSDATVKKVEVPATFKTMRMRKLVSPAKENRIKIPAKYEIVPKRTKIADAKQEWRPVLCETNTTKDLVLQIQRSLKTAGFNPGQIDGVLGRDTMAAVDAYQRKHSLAHGGLTLQTLDKLGIRVGG